MSLENLLKTGQLKPHKTDRKEIGRLLVAARRNLADTRAEISPTTWVRKSIEPRLQLASKRENDCWVNWPPG